MNANEDCVAYAGHLQAEHRALHRRLRDLQAELNRADTATISQPMLDRMIETGEQLARELTVHFLEEDRDGCLEYAVSRVPALAGEVTALETEHPALLAELRRMVEMLRNARSDELDFADVKRQFDAFVVRMLAHETRETRVVEKGFNMSLDE